MDHRSWEPASSGGDMSSRLGGALWARHGLGHEAGDVVEGWAARLGSRLPNDCSGADAVRSWGQDGDGPPHSTKMLRGGGTDEASHAERSIYRMDPGSI